MSPNSSRTCLIDGNVRSATLRTISLFALPRVAISGARNSTPWDPICASRHRSRGRPPPLRATPRWYRGAIVWGSCRAVSVTRRACRTRTGPPTLAAAAAAAAMLAASGCGGGARLDAREPSGSYALEVVKAAFPAKQAIARPTVFALQVRNTGSGTVPNVAVTLDSFYYTEHYPELA